LFLLKAPSGLTGNLATIHQESHVGTRVICLKGYPTKP
jgi:hypothetical protein